MKTVPRDMIQYHLIGLPNNFLGYEKDIPIDSFSEEIDSQIITTAFDIYEPDTKVQQLSE